MNNNKLRWTYLAHLGFNMWLEPPIDSLGIHGQKGWNDYVDTSYKLRFDEDYWKEMTLQLKEAGCNTILLDLGEGVRYESHPELAVEGSLSKEKLSAELNRLRNEGFEVIPKLNFSASHDIWLGEYARMLSTSVYYRVVEDLIREVAELFESPKLFHLGMDEETAKNQHSNNYAVIRQGEQWWYDFGKMVSAVEHAGCRPWIWSDYAWGNEESFFANMSTEVVQSNWYYGDFDPSKSALGMIDLYDKLEAHGFDQIPTGSNWSVPDNFSRTVNYGVSHIAPERLLGFMQTPWYPTIYREKSRHDQAIADVAAARRCYENQ